MLNFVAIVVFYVAVACVIAMVVRHLQRIRVAGPAVCNVCEAPASQIQDFICLSCGNDSRQWGIRCTSNASPIRTVEQVLLLTIVLALISMMAWGALPSERGRSETTSGTMTLERQPVAQLDLSRTKTSLGGKPIALQLDGMLFRRDGALSRIEAHDPPGRAVVTDPDGRQTVLNGALDDDLLDKWINGSITPEVTDTAIRRFIMARFDDAGTAGVMPTTPFDIASRGGFGYGSSVVTPTFGSTIVVSAKPAVFLISAACIWVLAVWLLLQWRAGYALVKTVTEQP